MEIILTNESQPRNNIFPVNYGDCGQHIPEIPEFPCPISYNDILYEFSILTCDQPLGEPVSCTRTQGDFLIITQACIYTHL